MSGGLLAIALAVVGMNAPAAATRPAAAPHAAEVALDTPTPLVADSVKSYTIAGNRLFWSRTESCAPSLAAAGANAPQRALADRFETIGRRALAGLSNRDLFVRSRDLFDCTDFSTVDSNIVSDGEFVYWSDDEQNGLVKLSSEAVTTTAQTLLTTSIAGEQLLADDGDVLYALSKAGGLWRYNKAANTAAQMLAPSMIGITSGSTLRQLRVSGRYLYWLDGTNLRRVNKFESTYATIQAGVTGYHPEGRRLLSCTFPSGTCFYTDLVLVAKGHQVFYFDSEDNSLDPTPGYTSASASATVFAITSSTSKLFVAESVVNTCSPFCSYNGALKRVERSSGAATVIFVPTPQFADNWLFDLRLLEGFLYWRNFGELNRMSSDASAFPMTNMRLSNIEVTQAIQDPANSIPLIARKRTVARVTAISDGPNVANVSARLYRLNSVGVIIDGPLFPWYPGASSSAITVRSAPDRADQSHTFNFDLPPSWVSSPGQLRLRATLNEPKYPPESSYSDNTLDVGPLTLNTSGRLQSNVVGFGYRVGSTTYWPSATQDMHQLYSWVRRAFPLASTPGYHLDSTPGFRPRQFWIFDEGLGPEVARSTARCINTYQDNPSTPENEEGDRNFCGSDRMHARMNQMRSEYSLGSQYIYGMVSDGYDFVRGYQSGPQASGPTGPDTWGWDDDGSYGDWYGAHEIGHTVGRAHSFGDASYPHPNQNIGTSTMWGTDVGDTGLNPRLKRRIYPGTGDNAWHDVMSYSDKQWISDYTYNGIRAFLGATASSASARIGAEAAPASVFVDGDFLTLAGTVKSDNSAGSIVLAKRLASLASIPPRSGTQFSIRLRNAAEGELARYDFTPNTDPADNNGWMPFYYAVNFVNGTRFIDIMANTGDVRLARLLVSSNAPVVNAVSVAGAPGPIGNSAVISWNASDADGDTLTFDVLYSRDNGATFAPVHLGVSGSNVNLDTSRLGGSTQAMIRVVAHDGVLSAAANSAAFTMANKPPVPIILDPANNTQFAYEQTLIFSGAFDDAQAEPISDSNMRWLNSANALLGTGSTLAINTLQPGTHTIRFEVINAAGQSASASVTVVIRDNFAPPPDTISAAPDQVGWNVTSAASGVQTSTLSLTNIGATSINWTASESAPWLSVSATSGSTPAVLTLSADPAGMANGELVSTTLTITDVNGGIRQIPVSLWVGDVWERNDPRNPQASQPPQGGKVYLPLTIR
jgi:hypothetical protein